MKYFPQIPHLKRIAGEAKEMNIFPLMLLSKQTQFPVLVTLRRGNGLCFGYQQLWREIAEKFFWFEITMG